MQTPITRNGLDVSKLRQGSFFTKEGKQRIPGTTSVATPLELLRFESREMSAESAAVLRRRLERVVAEFVELADLDAAAPAGRRTGMALLVACRPWQFSVVNALKRRKGL